MAEPRARVRQKGQVFTTDDLSALLTAFSNPPQSLPTPEPNQSAPPPQQLPTTLSTLDELLTDFIIETCHYAALSASYSRRQKIKADDFKFVLRANPVLLGRVQENSWRERDLKEKRKALDAGLEGEVGLMRGMKAGAGEDGAGDGGEGELGEGGGEGGQRKKRRRKGGRKKREAGED